MLKIYLTSEYDAILARQKAKQMAKHLGYDIHEQVRIATAVSECIRISLNDLREGEVTFFLKNIINEPMFMINIKGYEIVSLITNNDFIKDNNYKASNQSSINYASLLVDKLHIEYIPGEGRSILLEKAMPKASLPMTEEKFDKVIEIINNIRPQTPIDDIRQQNQELISALVELKKRQEEINELNKELFETNKGVIALSNELEEKAEFLKQSNEVTKSFFLNVSHEFKTPIHSILGMSGLLLGRIDGELNMEQEKQVLFIQKAAGELLEMVSDILDISKIEAGKVQIHPIEFELEEIFLALRGMFKPINTNRNVCLIFELPKNMPTLYTDDQKLSQIIRNYISNALKFTIEGEVRVSARFSQSKEELTVFVEDTGIGIAEGQQDLIFKEFTQIDNPIQKNVKGTGIGLPLSKNLAELLGGNVSVQSQLNVGSVFSVTIPIKYKYISNTDGKSIDSNSICAGNENDYKKKVLVIDDDKSFHYILQKTISDKSYSIIAASDGNSGLYRAINEKPDLILLDLSMPGLSGYEVLTQLKSNTLTKDIPVIIVTSNIVSEYDKINGKVIAVFSKKDLSYKDGINNLKNIIKNLMI
jgi:signal transduction histidine kinase